MATKYGADSAGKHAPGGLASIGKLGWTSGPLSFSKAPSKTMFLPNYHAIRDFVVVTNTKNRYSLREIRSGHVIEASLDSLKNLDGVERDSDSLVVPGQRVRLFCKWDAPRSRWAVYPLRPDQEAQTIPSAEGRKAEFKSKGVGTFEQDVCSLANCAGGDLWWGVGDDGSVIGIDALVEKYGGRDKLTCHLRNRLRQTTNTNLFLDVRFTFFERDGRTLLKITVPSSRGVVLYGDALYVRSQNTTQRLSGDRMLSFIYERMKNGRP